MCGINYNGTPCYFQKNLQGDIIAIVDASGAVVGKYFYDAWGKCTNITTLNADGTVSTSTTHIARINPFRYRGYYYDTETGFYYLQSRYYDPSTGRFINGDDVLSCELDTLNAENNLFAYTCNNPVNNSDLNGSFPVKKFVEILLGGLIGGASQYISDVLANLLDCALDKKSVTKQVWKRRSGWGSYISSVASGAFDFAFSVGLYKNIGISSIIIVIGHFINFFTGKGFSFSALIKDLAWNVLLTMVTKVLVKKFSPKQGKKLNKYIREKFNVKGTNQYKYYWNRMCDSVDEKGRWINVVINTIKNAASRILELAETLVRDCIIKALEAQY